MADPLPPRDNSSLDRNQSKAPFWRFGSRSRIKAVDTLLHGRGEGAAENVQAVRHHRLHPHSALYEDAPTVWREPQSQPSLSARAIDEPHAHARAASHGWVWALFLGSLLFFLGVAAFSLYVWLGDRNAVSVRKVALSFDGPLTTGGGEEALFTLTLRNQNPMDLKNAVLTVEYPDGTRKPGDIATPLRTQRIPLGDVKPGDERVQQLRLLFFGNQNEVKEFRARVEYTIEGSRATYVKEASYTTTLTSSPIIVRMSAVSEVVSGQISEFLVEVVNNSEQTLRNLLAEVQLPPSVRFVGAEPSPGTGASLWRIAQLPPQAIFPIRLTLLPTGTEGEVRTFRVTVGEEHPDAPGTIVAAFGSLLWEVRLSSPFVRLAVEVNGQKDETVSVPAGSPAAFNITYHNTLPVSVYDLVIEARLRGEGFDKFSVEPEGQGFYDSTQNIVRWHPRDLPVLREIQPGGSGSVAFTITTLPPTRITTRAPRFFVAIHAQARRVLETQVPETLEAAVEREVRLATTPQLMQFTRYSDGPFTNTGPIPPKVDERTTYTITWRVVNPLNDLRKVRLSARLPSYVEWTGNIYPADASIRFNPVSGEVVWEAETIPAGSGVNRPAREVSFQVAIRPGASQVGNAPLLVSEVAGEATDAFTQSVIPLSAPPATTELKLDPAYSRTEGSKVGKVVP